MADEGEAVASPCKKPRKELRKYDRLPVKICDNHDEVLHHIYRSIASRYLPFQGITLLHFDSHPDLTIPTRLSSEVVFNPGQLMEELSIADWILPAVYAGHISHVVWVKPPWADQMNTLVQRFHVGRHRGSGYLRVTCREDYFIEELLYAPLEDLENAKEVELTILTLDTRSMHPNETDICKSTKDAIDIKEKQQSSLILKPTVNDSTNTTIDEHKSTKDLCCQNACHNSTEESSYVPDTKNSEDLSGFESFDDHEIFKQEAISGAKSIHHQSKQEALSGAVEHTSTDNNQIRNCNELKHKPSHHQSKQVTVTCRERIKEQSSVQSVVSKLQDILADGQPYILDIDMDFFSTTNPFLELFTEDDFKALQEIYKFTPPLSSSEKDFTECIEERSAQLDLIEGTYEGIQSNPTATSSEKPSNINQVLAALIRQVKGREETTDLKLLHSAGMTIDLPHHISSMAEINSLLHSLTTITMETPRPILVTMARSAYDEYTPSFQVDYIQKQLIGILRKSYGDDEIDIHLDYETLDSDDTN